MARRYCWRALHAHVHCRFGADLLCTAQAGQQRFRFAGGVLQSCSVALEATNELNLLATLSPLANADALRVLDPEQLHALAYLPTMAYGYGFGVSLIFFGCVCLVVGHLIFRSGYLPKALSVLMQVAGLCYLTNSFALILSHSLADRLFPAILLPALVGKASLCLWLLVKGVNVSKWKARASAKPAPSALSGALK